MVVKRDKHCLKRQRTCLHRPLIARGGVVLPALLLMLFFIPTAPGWAQSYNSSQVTILKSKELVPYNLAQKGFQDIMGGKETVYTLDDQVQKSKESVSKILRQSPRLLHVIGTPAARMVLSEKITMPIVFSMILNPEIISKIKGPVAGCIALPSPQALFQQMQKIMPDIRSIGTAYDPKHTGFLVIEGMKVAKELDIELVALPVSSLGEALKSLEKLATKVDALWILPDRTVMRRQSFEYMLLTSFRNRIPLIAISEKYVKQGALMTLKLDYRKMGQQAGRIAEQIINKKLPQNRTTEFAKGDKLVINLRTAEKLGIKIPASILLEAILVNK